MGGSTNYYRRTVSMCGCCETEKKQTCETEKKQTCEPKKSCG